MSIEEELKQRETEEKKYVPLNEVPQTVKAKIIDFKFKDDARGNNCFYLYLQTPDKNMIVQKYTPTGFKELRTAIDNAGGSAELKKKFTTWEQKMVGRNKFPRLLPKPATKEGE